MQNVVPWLYLLVPLGLLITFVYVPVVNLFYYSVTNWDGITPNPSLVGLSNYKEIFTNPVYFDVFKVAVYYLVASVVQIGDGALLRDDPELQHQVPQLLEGRAVLPVSDQRRRDLLHLSLLLPARGHSRLGAQALRVPQRASWLGNPHLVNYSLAGVSVWRYMGLNFVLFLGAIQSIPSMLYEAADLDGASAGTSSATSSRRASGRSSA